MRNFILLAGLCFVVGCGPGGNTVTGKVTLSDGGAAPRGTVILMSEAGTFQGAIGADGTYTIEAVAAGHQVSAVLHQAHDDRVDAAARPAHDPVYLLAFCAADAATLPEPEAALWLFDDAAESVYEHYYHEIRKNMAAGVILQEKEREIESLQAALAEKPRSAAPWWRRS